MPVRFYGQRRGSLVRIDVPLVAAAAAAVTWDPANKGADVSLSNGNLTATQTGHSADNAMGRATAAIVDAIYWEQLIVNDIGSASGAGITNASQTFLQGEWLGYGTNSIGIYSNGDVYQNYSGTGTFRVNLGISFASGDIVCTAANKVLGKIWWRVNGGAWKGSGGGSDNPATGAGGFDFVARIGSGAAYPAFNVAYSGGAEGQVTLVPSVFSFTPPAGFSAPA
jgi:hypothetical protein